MWKGKVPKSANTDAKNEQGNPTFEQFQEMQYGIRALYRLLVTYVNKYNLRSVNDIIDRFAPASDNSEAARSNYKQYIINYAGTDRIHNAADLYAIANGIMIFETSKNDFDTYIIPYVSTAQRITDLTDLKELQPIVETNPEKKKEGAVLAKLGLASFLIFSFFNKSKNK